MKCGSVDSLKCSLRCGLRPKARQMRPIVEGLKPEARAIERRLQCVAPRGSDSRVRTTTRSTASSDTLRGVPGRGSSSKPAQPARRKRRRHLPTVARVTPSSLATATSLPPRALRRTMRALRASACAVLRRRRQRSNCWRWRSVSCGAARVW